MIPASFVRIFSAMILSLAFGSSFAQSDAPQAIIATYEGLVFNGDNMDPILTTFIIEDGKKLKGTYVIEDEEGFESGTLTDCTLEGTYTVTCTWKDKYGAGVARILFSADYRAFNGFWGETSDTTFQPWNGVRKEPESK